MSLLQEGKRATFFTEVICSRRSFPIGTVTPFSSSSFRSGRESRWRLERPSWSYSQVGLSEERLPHPTPSTAWRDLEKEPRQVRTTLQGSLGQGRFPSEAKLFPSMKQDKSANHNKGLHILVVLQGKRGKRKRREREIKKCQTYVISTFKHGHGQNFLCTSKILVLFLYYKGSDSTWPEWSRLLTHN